MHGVQKKEKKDRAAPRRRRRKKRDSAVPEQPHDDEYKEEEEDTISTSRSTVSSTASEGPWVGSTHGPVQLSKYKRAQSNRKDKHKGKRSVASTGNTGTPPVSPLYAIGKVRDL